MACVLEVGLNLRVGPQQGNDQSIIPAWPGSVARVVHYPRTMCLWLKVTFNNMIDQEVCRFSCYWILCAWSQGQLPTFSREFEDFKKSTRYSLVNFEDIDKLYLLCALFGPAIVNLATEDNLILSNLNPNRATWSQRLTTSCFMFSASDAILHLTERGNQNYLLQLLVIKYTFVTECLLIGDFSSTQRWHFRSSAVIPLSQTVQNYCWCCSNK